MNDRELLLQTFYRDRRLAHRELFNHRHKDDTPEFHSRIIGSLHDAVDNRCIISFRGSGKSTLAEEAMILQVGFREFHTGLILGASLPLACQRLHSIRREIEKNKKLAGLFGDLRGQPWTDDKLEFTNGISITAMGKGQALRGSKDEIFRPDFVLADDIEDRESVRTPEGREKIQTWFLGEVLPAMDPQGRCRVLANILDPECLAEKLKNPDSGFTVETYPWEYKDPATGERKATWAARFPLEAIDAKRKSLFALGRAKEYQQEFMCIAVSDRERPFRQDMKRVEPRGRIWELVNVMYDPARTAGAKSATTGKAVWSWIGPKLTVWELGGHKWMPNEIIADMFKTNEQYHPARMGFEADGLNEWALQPIRAEQLKRGVMLPLVPVKAPTGKIDFIKGLQVFFNAREVWFTRDFPEAWGQFLGFPSGNIDVPNALAYALHQKMKPGVAVFENFNVTNISDDLQMSEQEPAWLALNATLGQVTGVLLQFINGNMRIYADWVREGDADSVLSGMIRTANLEAGKIVRLTAGPLHFDRYNNVGLVAAARRIPVELRPGRPQDKGHAEIRRLLGLQSRGLPSLIVSSGARWTLNGFSGAYCRAVAKGGVLADFAEDGVYRVLMEGLESFAGLIAAGATDGEGSDITNATSATGQRYYSARPQR